MSYICNNCEKVFFDDFSEIKNNKCKICWRENSLTQIDCLYCDDWKYQKGESTHFLCEECGVGMCDHCYDLWKEHDGHYHELCDSTYSCDLEYNNQCEILYKYFWKYPSYICEKCLSKILNDSN